MDIRIDSLLAGARKAKGTVVIIDVYRAFTTAAVAFEQGASKIILTAEVQDALMLRRLKAGDLCVGEVDGKKPDEFDYNNSPHALSRVDLKDRVPILSTRAGTVGVNAARHADRIFGASLVNAAATAKVIAERAPSLVTLVAMGWGGLTRTDEDEVCAVYLKNLLQGHQPDAAAAARFIRSCRESLKFDDPAQPHFHPKDREIALKIDSMDFAIEVAQRNRMLVATRVDPRAADDKGAGSDRGAEA